MEFKINYIVKPQENFRYKGIIWLGTRNQKPDVNNFLHANSSVTVSEEIKDIGSLPCLLVWDTTEGEKQYAEAVRIVR